MTARSSAVILDDDERRRQRRARLAATDHRYGLDYVDVLDVTPDDVSPPRWTLRLAFVPDTSGSSTGHGFPPSLRPEQISICRAGDPAGATLPEIDALSFSSKEGDSIVLEVALRTLPPLAVQRGALTVALEHIPDVDPLFDSAEIHLGTARRADDGAGDGAPAALTATPGASYSGKDYAAFVAVMMDRLRLTLPGWEERSPADIGVMLVELLAYAADYLSYEQDAAATEAYLRTARKRRSLRRHARLLDYNVDDGQAARVWLQVTCGAGGAAPRPQESGGPEVDPPILRKGTTFRTGSLSPPVVFESLHDAPVYERHDEMALYAWGIEPFVVPAGATEAVLAGTFPDMRIGDVLLLVSYGEPSTSTPSSRPPPYTAHAVRLSRAPAADSDPVMGLPITRISWFSDDALPFPLFAGETKGMTWSVALGNVILAEQHTTFRAGSIVPDGASGHARAFVVPLSDAVPLGPLPEGWQKQTLSVASAEPYDDEAARKQPAASALVQTLDNIRPCVQVTETRAGVTVAWTARRSFLTSARFARDVVVDTDDGDRIRLQFGDGTTARAFRENATLAVTFGVGGGPSGNVGRETIRVIGDDGSLSTAALAVKNWMPAVGGRDPETRADIKNRAPLAFLEQERCVSPADYAARARQIPGVLDAAATLAWTGSFRTAVIHVLPRASDTLDDALRERVMADLFARRLAGTDIEIGPPRYVPVAISLRVGLKPGHEPRAVLRTLERELGSGTLTDGRAGLFHRDSYGFGQALYLAPILARAAAVPGVAWVEAVRFQRWTDPAGAPAGDEIPIGATEVARVQGDLDSPQGGLVELEIEGDP